MQTTKTLPILTECLIIGGCIAIALPFWKALSLGAMLAIACWPLQQRMERWTNGRRELSASIITLAFALVLIVPLAWAGTSIAQHLDGIRAAIQDAATNGIAAPEALNKLPKGTWLIDHWNAVLHQEGLGAHVKKWASEQKLGAHGAEAGEWVKAALETTTFALISMFVFLGEAKHITRILNRLVAQAIPKHADKVVPHAYKSIRGIVVGLISVGLLEGVIVTIAGVCTHVPYSLLILPAITIGSIIPFCVMPVAILFGLAGILTNGVTSGVIFLVVSLGALSIIDHVVRPKAIDGGTKIGFLPVLIGMLGGLHVFGMLGIFIGPSIISLANVLYISDDEEEETTNPAEEDKDKNKHTSFGVTSI